MSLPDAIQHPYVVLVLVGMVYVYWSMPIPWALMFSHLISKSAHSNIPSVNECSVSLDVLAHAIAYCMPLHPTSDYIHRLTTFTQ